MIRSYRSEWVKLLRPRFFLIALGASAGAGILGSVVAVTTASDASDVGRGPMSTMAELEAVDGLLTGATNLAMMFGILALALGAYAAANEFALGTVRTLIVRESRRVRLWSGKLLATSSFVALMALVASGASGIAMYGLAPTRDVDTSLWMSSDGVVAAVGATGSVVGSSLVFCLVGFLLGMVFRSSAAAIAIGIGWMVVLEGLVVSMWDAAANWLPGELAGALSAGGTADISMASAIVGCVAWGVVAWLGSITRFRRLEV